MSKVRFYLRQYKDTKNGVIWVSFYVNREKVHFSTKISVQVCDWSLKEERIKGKSKESIDNNLVLDSIESRINDVFVRYRLKNRELTREKFLRAYNRPSDYESFEEYVYAQKRKLDRYLRPNTIKIEESSLKKFCETYKSIGLDEIDEKLIKEYHQRLICEYHNNQNTAGKNMNIIKKYVLMAVKDGYMEENPFDAVKVRRGNPSISYLEEEELKKMMKLYDEGDMNSVEYKTLEVFLLACFTSLHIGDLKKLRLEDLKNGFIEYTRIKTYERNPIIVKVPLNEKALYIIRNITGNRKRGQILENTPAEQTMNRMIKEICKKCDVDKKISLKSGRHTYATIFLKKTKDIASLKSILGHSDIKDTLIYAHVLEDSLVEGSNAAFNDL